MTSVANIGKSLFIRGELSGSEDLTIDGNVDGTITMNGQMVMIGENGRVKADIQAKSVMVGGQVKGNITADERVEVVATGTMVGNVRARRVVLADGAHFKGSIDMDANSKPGTVAAASAASKPTVNPSMSHGDKPVLTKAKSI